MLKPSIIYRKIKVQHKIRIIIASTFVLVCGALAIFASDRSHQRGEKAHKDVNVISAEQFVLQMSPQTELASLSRSGQDRSNLQLRSNEMITGKFVNELRSRTRDTVRDPAWAEKTRGWLEEMVKDLPYLVKKPDVRCGATDCEITLVTLSGLTENNKKVIVETLAQPAYGDDKSRMLTVRQIWSNKDLGEPGSGFHAFYIKR